MMKPRQLVLTALLASLALAFNIAEGFLPLPLPGVKLGAANVFALAALVLMGPRAAFAVTLLRVCLAWFVSANWFAFLCSLAGGLLATAAMVLRAMISIFTSRCSRNSVICAVKCSIVATDFTP